MHWALRAGSLDVDLLMVVAAAGAAAIGQVFDGALLIVIFATSGALEAAATQRTAAAVRCLLDVAPTRVTRLAGDDEQVVDPADLVVGDVVLVRPGEDGRVLEGASEVDQASITGEPLPAVKHPGAQVYAGTVNGTGSLRVLVERPAGDTVVARIVALVEQATATKARIQLFIEKVEQRYSVGVVVVTLAIFAVPLLVGALLEPTLLRAMTFMIVASPCAVVLATMPPLLAAIANAGCQLGVFLAYASPRGRALIDRELYLPKSWIADPDRCAGAGIPAGTDFATKPAQGIAMLARAHDAGVLTGWVTADEAYGQNRGFRDWLAVHEVPFVLATRSDDMLTCPDGQRHEARNLVALAGTGGWERRSAGPGAHGERLYDWVVLALHPAGLPSGWGHLLAGAPPDRPGPRARS